MKKIFMSLLLIVLLVSSCYAATSEDMGVYVRQDVFDAKMEALMAEMRLMNEKLLREVREEINEVRKEINEVRKEISGLREEIGSIKSDIKVLTSRIDALSKRMDSLETMIYWILATLGVAFAAITLAPYLKDIRKPSITLEQIEALIDTKINARLQV